MPSRRDNDAADDLADALDQIETQGKAILADNITARQHYMWAQQNRLGLLWVHAAVGVLVGACMLVWGIPANMEELFGIWSRTALAATGLIGGGLLAWGLSRKPVRSITYEASGLAVLGIWDLAIMFYFALLLSEHPPDAAWPWEPINPDAARPYPIFVYAGLLALIALHVYTLWGLLKLRALEKAAEAVCDE